MQLGKQLIKLRLGKARVGNSLLSIVWIHLHCLSYALSVQLQPITLGKHGNGFRPRDLFHTRADKLLPTAKRMSVPTLTEVLPAFLHKPEVERVVIRSAFADHKLDDHAALVGAHVFETILRGF